MMNREIKEMVASWFERDVKRSTMNREKKAFLKKLKKEGKTEIEIKLAEKEIEMEYFNKELEYIGA